ncbi:MAG: hypothetical protein NC305_08445 [Lachnospiraceae bacterium]|nr:hypothetical protein [Butyrivibrio sp.]MCM1343392.1 hypothetical protein [Muribaculaceae bacterium]MCM1410561.1 hypothetical protein [Lachnospiraceae bacterium]
MYDSAIMKLLAEQYKKENIKISFNAGKAGRGGHCVIYCSSHNIWYPNAEKYFRESILNRDYYEWMKMSYIDSEKDIYLRDIYKSWYVSGVNAKLDSIDNLAEYLEKVVKEYKVITVGISAGGYLAVILGVLLNAERVYAFSAQFDLNGRELEKNAILQKYKNDAKKEKYYDLVPFIKQSTVPIYYIYPMMNELDAVQKKRVENCSSVRILGLKSKKHGVVILRSNLPDILKMQVQDLDVIFGRFKDRQLTPIEFSIRFVGALKTVGEIEFLTKKIFSKIKEFTLKTILAGGTNK